MNQNYTDITYDDDRHRVERPLKYKSVTSTLGLQSTEGPSVLFIVCHRHITLRLSDESLLEGSLLSPFKTWIVSRTRDRAIEYKM